LQQFIRLFPRIPRGGDLYVEGIDLMIELAQGLVDAFRFPVQVVLDVTEDLVTDILIGGEGSVGGLLGKGGVGVKKEDAGQDYSLLFQVVCFGKDNDGVLKRY
jgi:hypothetical protein